MARRRVIGGGGLVALALGAALGAWVFVNTGAEPARAVDAVDAGDALAQSVALGRHVVRIGGCNDCHTPGFMQIGEKVPEKDWLIGVPLGWRGPWGTTYGSNLRLTAASMPAEAFVAMCRQREGLPPMPWPSLHAMTDAELRGVYDYLRHLGPAGERTPPPLAPNQEPTTPYLNMTPVMPAANPAVPGADAE